MSEHVVNEFSDDDIAYALDELKKAREHGAHWRCNPDFTLVCTFVEGPIPKDTSLAFGQHCRRCVIALMVLCRNDTDLSHFLMESIEGDTTVQMRGYVECLWKIDETRTEHAPLKIVEDYETSIYMHDCVEGGPPKQAGVFFNIDFRCRRCIMAYESLILNDFERAVSLFRAMWGDGCPAELIYSLGECARELAAEWGWIDAYCRR